LKSEYEEKFSMSGLALHEADDEIMRLVKELHSVGHKFKLYLNKSDAKLFEQSKTINSSGTAMRSFCQDCGSGLFYRNAEILPSIVDIQSSTLDDPDALPPVVQIQVAERLQWMKNIHELPEVERFPE
jgi:hypothetical protein